MADRADALCPISLTLDSMNLMSVNAGALRELHRIHRQLTRPARSARSWSQADPNPHRRIAQVEEQAGQAPRRTENRPRGDGSKQLLLENGESKIAELKVKLNQANTNREYQALRRIKSPPTKWPTACWPMKFSRRWKNSMDESSCAGARSPRGKTKEELAKAQQKVRSEEEMLQSETKRLEGELAAAEKALPDDFRELYRAW